MSQEEGSIATGLLPPPKTPLSSLAVGSEPLLVSRGVYKAQSGVQSIMNGGTKRVN